MLILIVKQKFLQIIIGLNGNISKKYNEYLFLKMMCKIMKLIKILDFILFQENLKLLLIYYQNFYFYFVYYNNYN